MLFEVSRERDSSDCLPANPFTSPSRCPHAYMKNMLFSTHRVACYKNTHGENWNKEKKEKHDFDFTLERMLSDSEPTLGNRSLDAQLLCPTFAGSFRSSAENCNLRPAG